MSLQVDQGSLSLPTLVPGGSGVVKIVVINPNPAPVAVTSIRGQVSGLHSSCADDIRLGVMSDAGHVLARSGGRHEFRVPITFVQDAARLQDCQNDDYRIDFTVTGSGK